MTHPNPAYYGECPRCDRPKAECRECGARADQPHEPWCEQSMGWTECPTFYIMTARQTMLEPEEGEEVCCGLSEED